MASCGVLVDSENDLDPEEQSVLYGDMQQDLMSAMSFGRDIEAGKYGVIGSSEFVGRGARAREFNALHNRAELYVQRMDHFKVQGQRFGCANRMMVWRFGKTRDHCVDCAYYEGQVHRMKTWESYGALPQSRALECGGWRCDCQLIPTDGRARGRLRSPSGGRGWF